MRTFKEYHDLREAGSTVPYEVLSYEPWKANFQVGDIIFRVSISDDYTKPGEYDVSFAQQKEITPEGERWINTPRKLGFVDLGQLFSTIDDVLVDFVQYKKEKDGEFPTLQIIGVHLQTEKGGFDPKRHGGYQSMLRQSKLVDLGYRMEADPWITRMIPQEKEELVPA